MHISRLLYFKMRIKMLICILTLTSIDLNLPWPWPYLIWHEYSETLTSFLLCIIKIILKLVLTVYRYPQLTTISKFTYSSLSNLHIKVKVHDDCDLLLGWHWPHFYWISQDTTWMCSAYCLQTIVTIISEQIYF